MSTQELTRLQAIPAERLTDAQRSIRERIVQGPRGKISPPFEVLLHSAPLAGVLEQVGVHLRYHSALPGWLRELSILVVCRHWQAGYEWSSHVPLALAEGVSSATVQAIAEQNPEALPDHDAVIAMSYAFTAALLNSGHVSDEVYTAMHKTLGAQGLIDLTGLVGYYSALAMTINAHRIAAMPGTELPWKVQSL